MVDNICLFYRQGTIDGNRLSPEVSSDAAITEGLALSVVSVANSTVPDIPEAL